MLLQGLFLVAAVVGYQPPSVIPAPGSVAGADAVAEVRALLRRISPSYNLADQLELSVAEVPDDMAAKGDVGFFEIAAASAQAPHVAAGMAAAIRGSNAVDLTSGVHWYLKYYANCSISWWGDQLDLLPAAGTALPALPPDFVPEVRGTSHSERYYMNTCTFGYSTTWWDWARWEREIDWMALNGINMPLGFVGQEFIFREVLLDLGLSEAELGDFFSGPAVLPWMRMGNLQGWLGPLPAKSWIDAHHALQLRILARMRALGMRVVLPAFSGLVPVALTSHFPNASYVNSSGWALGIVTTFLEATDPLFASIGSAYIAKQAALYNGTDHLYNCDLYNEMSPPSNSTAYLGDVSRGVYAAMVAADETAVWVMQGWLFHNSPSFWQPAQMKAMLHAVPHGRMLILDLYSEDSPVWSRTESFYGTPFVWNMLHNFGGRSGMFARLDTIATAPAAALEANSSAGAGQLRGLGLTPEAIETNPIVYDLMMENVWRSTAGIVDLDGWVAQYTARRYGLTVAASASASSALAASKLLQDSVYNYVDTGEDKQGTSGSMFAGRPAISIPKVSCCDFTEIYYNASDVVAAWRLLLDAGAADAALAARTPFLYDLVVTGVQALSNLALEAHRNTTAAYNATDLGTFDAAAGIFLAAARGADKLLATRKQFLLGHWIASARAWATDGPGGPGDGMCNTPTEERVPCGASGISQHDCELLMCCYNESTVVGAAQVSPSGAEVAVLQVCFKSPVSDFQLYERNARTLVTLWGPYNAGLHEYSYRLWAGLVGDFYVPRWEAWFADVRAAIVAGQSFNQDKYDAKIQQFEEAWTRQSNEYATEPLGDAVAISQRLLVEFFD